MPAPSVAVAGGVVAVGGAVSLGGAAVARRGRLSLAASSLAMPFYWLLISFAAYRALWQLLTAPHFWEKTRHRARQSTASAG